MTTTRTPSSLVDDLRRHLTGSVVGPGDDRWEQARRGWNLQVDQRPAAVVNAGSVADISTAVRTAADHGLAVTVQPRGHGGTAALDGTVLVRPTALGTVDIDLDRRRARIGAAVRWQRVNEALTGTGLTGLAGSTGDVSVIGYTLGGGLSWFGRRYGLAAHRIVAAELVTPEARHVRVTERDDPELMWALRGGGGDFGIVTALEVELVPAQHVYGGRLVWPAEHAAAVLTAYAQTTAAAPEQLTAWAWLLNLPDAEFVPAPMRGRWAVAVDVTYLGDEAEAERHLRPLRALTPPPAGLLGTVALAHLGAIAAEPTEPTPLLDGAAMLIEFDESVVTTLLDAIAPGQPSPLAIVEIRHLAGAFARPDEHGAAGHLREPYLLLSGGPVPDPAVAPALEAHIDRIDAAVAGHSSGRLPPNLGHDAARIYPPHILARLRRIKQERDPQGRIRSNRPVLGHDDTDAAAR
jgi:FAD/FMN-containing dehydrogenase